jgi:hypothetical protein
MASISALSGAVRSFWKAAQQSPSMQLVENNPGTPRSPRRATQRTVRSTDGETASESQTGDPSMTNPDTISGWRTASERARAPPRL